MMKTLMIGASCLAMAACATTPARNVYEVKAGFAAALEVAVAYSALPPCPQSESLCSDAATVQKIYTAAKLVQQDLDTAQAAAQMGQSPAVIAQEMAVAQTDLDALTALTSQVKTQ